VRLAGQELEGDGLRWTFAAPAGTRAALPFFCDFEVAVEGARLVDGELRLAFPGTQPEGASGAWSTCEVRVRPR
ncbi:MAG: hypothetical protein HOP15_17260, partial [Planctomycetes bacterium]|nr:hypothetical protein [Planctomycetota bacterium]